MFTYLFPNFLIGLREGLEAALVVSILVAFLVRAQRRDRLPLVWSGVGAAVLLSVLFGAGLTYVWNNTNSFYMQELLGGGLSIIAVAFVTWMIFWMRRTARFLKKDLNTKLEEALSLGPLAIVIASFLAVAREGLETTLFFWSAARTSNQTAIPLTGFLIGIATAIVLGYLLYRSAITLNLSKFFTYTGIGLIFVAAGILAYGVYDLQEIEIIPGLTNTAFDISHIWRADSWYGMLVKGIFNFQPDPSVWQVVVWSVYIVAVLTAFLWPAKKPAKAAKPAKPAKKSQKLPAAAGSTQ